MSTWYPYKVKGASGSYDAEINGYSFNVSGVLKGVEGTNDIQQMYNAINDYNLPLAGVDLRGINSNLTGCWNREIECDAIGDGEFEIRIRYQHSPVNTVQGIQVRVNTQVSEVESNIDKNGDPINTVYKYPDDFGGDTPTPRQLELRDTYSAEQGGTYSKMVPETTRTYELREPIDPGTIKQYVNSTNSADWQDAGDKWKWMLVNISGSIDNSLQAPQEWVNTYTFQYKIDGWKPEVVHHVNNEPVPDPKENYSPDKPAYEGGSKVTIDAYQEYNFNVLFPNFV